jgi:hypothetical protein
MTKLIWALIAVAVAFVGYRLFLSWEKAKGVEEPKAVTAPASVSPESLTGLPSQLEPAYRAAKEKGATTFRAWFNANEAKLSDPRKAWIELELCVAMTRENPAEAKIIFARVKARVPPSSPVWPRMKELEKIFE